MLCPNLSFYLLWTKGEGEASFFEKPLNNLLSAYLRALARRLSVLPPENRSREFRQQITSHRRNRGGR